MSSTTGRICAKLMKKILPEFAENNHIYNFERNSINGVYLEVLEDKLRHQPKLPRGIKAWCHICNTGFKSIDDMNNHIRDGHRIFKG